MPVNITNEQFLTSSQSVQSRYVRLELLNNNFQTVDYVEGICINGSISINANSDIRRTASLNLSVKNSTFNVASGGRIWLERFVRIFVGVNNIRTGETIWTNCGIYIVDAPNYTYDLSTNTLNLSLLDLMAKLTGVRNGYLQGVPTILSAGENIRKAIIDTLELGGFTKYVVEEAPFPGVIPVDLEFSQGATIYELLSGLQNIYPNYEMFFDVNGVFYYKKIPTGNGEPIMADDSLFDSIITQETISVDFQNVKNSIEVYGRTHDPAHFSTETKIENNIVGLTIADVSSYTTDMIYGFTLTNAEEIKDAQLKINSLDAVDIKTDDENKVTIPINSEETYYCVQYKTTYWRWLGKLQAYGIAEDTNPESPFYINGEIGKIRLPLYDGDYANCLTDDLAQERAEYELWLHTNMNNTLGLQMVPVYWLDVNMLIEYRQKREKEPEQWIVKSIDMGLAPTDNMTLSAIKFYPKDYTSPEYDALEYIESSGTQYIDVGIIPNQNSRIVMEAKVVDGFAGDGVFIGANDGINYFTLGFNGGAEGWYNTRYGNNTLQSFPKELNSREKMLFDKNKNVTTIKEDTITSTKSTTSFMIDKPMYLFANNNNGTVEKHINMRLYSLKVYKGETLVRSFIPAMKKDSGEIGLYDTNELMFYTNKGTGTFIAGASKNN